MPKRKRRQQRVWPGLPALALGAVALGIYAWQRKLWNPIRYFTSTELYWFQRGDKDADYLTLWKDQPLAYTTGQELGADWYKDSYEEVIGVDTNGALFERAGDRLLRYNFYPATVMAYVSPFSLENRLMKQGDRLIQRVHVFRIGDQPIIDVVTMNEITSVVDEPRKKGFTYITTASHSEQGEWSAMVEWREDNTLVLKVTAISRLDPKEPPLIRPFVRFLQKRAHHLGIANFRSIVTTAEPTPEVKPAAPPAVGTVK